MVSVPTKYGTLLPRNLPSRFRVAWNRRHLATAYSSFVGFSSSSCTSEPHWKL